MLKCVMLDFGGTIVDFYDRERVARVYAKIFTKHGYKIDKQSIRRIANEEAKKHHRENYGKVRRHDYHLLISRVLKRMGYDVSVKKAKEMTEEINKELSSGNRPFPGTRSVLRSLRRRGLKIAVICNGTRDWVEDSFKRFGLDDYIDYIAISKEIGKEKSSLTPFRVVLRELKLKPSECIMVGDRLDEDMHAKRLGILTCHAAYGPKVPTTGNKIKPDFRITDIKQLVGVVDRIIAGSTP